jgi:hypothetical protein
MFGFDLYLWGTIRIAPGFSMGLVYEPRFPDLNTFITTSREEVSGVMGIFIVVLASY